MYPNCKHSTQRHGFTLLEVMVAVTILAGMALVMFGASSMMVDNKDVVEHRDERNHSVSFALNKMAEDLHSAFFIKSANLLGTQFEGEISFEGREDRLDFTSFTHLRYIKNAKETDMAEVSYYLVNDPEEVDRRVLMRREATQVDKEPQLGGRAYPLLKGVRSVRFQYLPEESDEYKGEWDTKSVSSGNKLPRAVKITLEVYMPEEEEPRTYSTLAPLKMRQPLEF